LASAALMIRLWLQAPMQSGAAQVMFPSHRVWTAARPNALRNANVLRTSVPTASMLASQIHNAPRANRAP